MFQFSKDELKKDRVLVNNWAELLKTGICVLSVKRYHISSYGDITFAAAGPRLWNSLPVQLRNPDITYGLLRRQLKGHLFRDARTQRSVTSDMRRHRKTPNYLLTYNIGDLYE